MPEVAKILVIDDSEDDRFLYRRVLKSANADYDVVEKGDGEDCLSFIAEENPACILLDYSLPGRNGIEVLKRIRSKHPYMPVLILTGQGNEALAVNAMREGAQHYISKASITAESLQRSIRVAIEHCALQRRIQEQREALELFTRALAHDLKEPVRTIRSFLDILSRPGLSPERAEKYFSYIHHAAERMGGLIDTVYFYLRMDRASQPPRENCDSRAVLSDAQENLAMLIKEKNAIIVAEDLPRVSANPPQLAQLLQNLISNALRYCEERPVIHISAERTDAAWLFRVRDNGVGVPAEYAEQIFIPFKRLMHTNHDGLGLGLAICKKIVDSQGGRIWCEPVTPHGACFCFTIAPAESGGETGQHALAIAAPMARENLASVMIVEDNEADIELIRFALQEEQNLRCNLHISTNGHEALARLDEMARRPDGPCLMLLDINMPGIDGFELLSAMHQSEGLRDIPVVMCSTSSYDKDIDRAKSLDAAGYIIKPFDFAKLRPILDRLPRLHLRQDEDGCALTCDAA